MSAARPPEGANAPAGGSAPHAVRARGGHSTAPIQIDGRYRRRRSARRTRLALLALALALLLLAAPLIATATAPGQAMRHDRIHGARS